LECLFLILEHENPNIKKGKLKEELLKYKNKVVNEQ